MFIPVTVAAVAFQQALIAEGGFGVFARVLLIAREFGTFGRMETIDSSPKPRLNRNAFVRALSEPLRWDILGALARGRALSVSDLAAQLGRDPDLVSKHLRVLRDVGVVVAERDAENDSRRQLYEVPGEFVTAPGTVDLGFCMLRFG